MTLREAVPTDRTSRTDRMAVAGDLAPILAARAAGHDADDSVRLRELRRPPQHAADARPRLLLHRAGALDGGYRVSGRKIFASGSPDLTLDGVFVPDAAISARRPSGRWSTCGTS